MIGLDTNILIRYLTQDDPAETPKATALIERGLTPEQPGFISIVALAETVWVLRNAYKVPPEKLADIVEIFIQAQNLVVQNEYEVQQAVVAVRGGRGSFADALVGILGHREGCKTTLTFDRKALRLGSFELL